MILSKSLDVFCEIVYKERVRFVIGNLRVYVLNRDNAEEHDQRTRESV